MEAVAPSGPPLPPEASAAAFWLGHPRDQGLPLSQGNFYEATGADRSTCEALPGLLRNCNGLAEKGVLVKEVGESYFNGVCRRNKRSKSVLQFHERRRGLAHRTSKDRQSGSFGASGLLSVRPGACRTSG